jgi:ParB family transcriptional regulator, chromosome partitioning protein
MERIALDLIEDNLTRIDANADVSDLLTSFSTQGQLSPIRVRPHPTKEKKYQVIFGSRRLVAARKLGWHEHRDAI